MMGMNISLTMKKIVLLLIMMTAYFVAAAQSAIKVDAPNIVGADEQFNVTFIIEGENKPSNFNWAPGDGFTLVWGPQKGESTSISIVNGKRTKSSQFTYTYILMPKKTGKFELPLASAKINGSSISSEAVTIEVLASGSSSGNKNASSASSGSSHQQSSTLGSISSSDLFLKFSLSKTSAVIGEPITAELKLYQRVDIAGFEGAKFPSFDGFWSQETAAPSNIEFHREDVGGQIYNAALLRRYVLIPQQSGTLTIDPAELVCLVNVRTASRTGNSIFDSFFDDGYNTVRKRITTAATHVQVKSLPAGAPSNFGGGVGKFRISAKLSKDDLKTHEASSLVITISGRGNVSLVDAPKVDFPPDLEVYDTKITENSDKSTGGTSGSKVFEFPFIPRSHGHFTIGPIEYSYYDVSAGKYETVSTEPIEFDVAKGTASEASQSSSSLVIPDRKGVKNLGEDIRFIYTGKPSYSFKKVFMVGNWYYWMIVVLLLAAACFVLYVMRGVEARRADVAGTRNRRATKMALSRLKMADGFLKKNLYSAFYEELHKALLGFISDKLNIGAEDLNKDNISGKLSEGNVPADIVSRFVSLLDACEFARYSPDGGHEAMNTHYNEAVNVISSIDSIMKIKKNGNFAGKATLVLALLLTMQGVIRANDTAYLDSLWQKGVTAYSDGHWNESLEAWTNIENTGAVMPRLYYNIGNAYFKLGDYAHAILYYERTLKSDPSCSDARYNLNFANSLIQDKIDSVPEFILKNWARKLSYVMDSDSWAILSLVLFAIALALGLLFLLGGRPALRRTGFYGFIVLIVVSCVSFGLSAWQRSMFMKTDYAIIMSPVSSVKSSPSSESSKDLFVLHEGTKVKVMDSVGLWKNISLSDGRQGWIQESDMQII